LFGDEITVVTPFKEVSGKYFLNFIISEGCGQLRQARVEEGGGLR